MSLRIKLVFEWNIFWITIQIMCYFNEIFNQQIIFKYGALFGEINSLPAVDKILCFQFSVLYTFISKTIFIFKN